MYYGSTDKATGWKEEDLNCWQVKLIKALLFFIPRANPDVEKYYPQVKTWLLEVNDEGFPMREIALDCDDKVLFCTPDDRNTGLWTDMGEQKITNTELSSISKEYFESLWHEKKYT